MTPTKRPAAPPGLDAPGRALWRAVLAQFELAAGELAVLEVACRSLDRMRAAEQVIATEGLTVTGRFSTQPHPLILVARDAGAALRASLKQIDVVLDEEPKLGRPGPKPTRRIRGQKAAIAERKATSWGTAG